MARRVGERPEVVLEEPERRVRDDVVEPVVGARSWATSRSRYGEPSRATSSIARRPPPRRPPGPRRSSRSRSRSRRGARRGCAARSRARRRRAGRRGCRPRRGERDGPPVRDDDQLPASRHRRDPTYRASPAVGGRADRRRARSPRRVVAVEPVEEREPVAEQPRHQEAAAHVLLPAQRPRRRRPRGRRGSPGRRRRTPRRVDEPARLAVLDLRDDPADAARRRSAGPSRAPRSRSARSPRGSTSGSPRPSAPGRR